MAASCSPLLMKMKKKIAIEILLVMAAIAVFIYNFSTQRKIAYIASVVAIGGTIAFLIVSGYTRR